MSENYKKDLEIDQGNLDIEWKKQAALFGEWGEKAAEANYQKDKKKEQLDLIKAQLDTEYRKKLKDEKPKEAEILSKVLQDKKYIDASEQYLKAYKTAKVLEVATRSFEHRKRALEYLTKLFLNNYYAEAYVPKKAKDVFNNQTRKEINSQLQKGEKRKPSLKGNYD